MKETSDEMPAQGGERIVFSWLELIHFSSSISWLCEKLHIMIFIEFLRHEMAES